MWLDWAHLNNLPILRLIILLISAKSLYPVTKYSQEPGVRVWIHLEKHFTYYIREEELDSTLNSKRNSKDTFYASMWDERCCSYFGKTICHFLLWLFFCIISSNWEWVEEYYWFPKQSMDLPTVFRKKIRSDIQGKSPVASGLFLGGFLFCLLPLKMLYHVVDTVVSPGSHMQPRCRVWLTGSLPMSTTSHSALAAGSHIFWCHLLFWGSLHLVTECGRCNET